MKTRKEHEAPEAVSKWGRKYHHIGIPTNKQMPDEVYISHLKFYVSGFPDSPFGIEWMRFEENSPVHELVQSVPHIAFKVENIDNEIKKHDLNVISPTNSPAEGIKVAMIKHNGTPIELIEFEKME